MLSPITDICLHPSGGTHSLALAEVVAVGEEEEEGVSSSLPCGGLGSQETCR